MSTDLHSPAACCLAVEVDPVDPEGTGDSAQAFKALGDPNRVEVLHLLSAAGEPVCVVDIESHLPVGQSTVSYHLKAMVEAGLLEMEKRGKWSYYSVRSARLIQLSGTLASYAADSST